MFTEEQTDDIFKFDYILDMTCGKNRPHHFYLVAHGYLHSRMNVPSKAWAKEYVEN